MAEKNSQQVLNRKASYEYKIGAKYNAGIILEGTEVKSIRAGNVNISDAYCIIDDRGRLVIKNMHVSEWKNASFFKHVPLRERELLLKKTELKKITDALKEQGTTVVPLKIFFSETGFVKLELGIAKGKKQYDKREDIKKRDIAREMERDS